MRLRRVSSVLRVRRSNASTFRWLKWDSSSCAAASITSIKSLFFFLISGDEGPMLGAVVLRDGKRPSYLLSSSPLRCIKRTRHNMLGHESFCDVSQSFICSHSQLLVWSYDLGHTNSIFSLFGTDRMWIGVWMINCTSHRHCPSVPLCSLSCSPQGYSPHLPSAHTPVTY